MPTFTTLFADILAATTAAIAQPATPPEQPAESAQPLSQAEILALETERFSRLTVPVTIQGTGPYRFMIDTGAQSTVLSRRLADDLGLDNRSQARLVAMASAQIVETASVDDIALGSREFSVAKAPILEGRNIGTADGILGIDSLQGQRVLFDFENRELAVADARELGGNRGFDIVVRARRTHGQLIIHRARIDGVGVSVIIDTGAQSSIGNMALERRLRSPGLTAITVITDINGMQVASPVKVASELTMSGVKITNIPIAFTDGPTFEELNLADKPALVLGMSELHLFRRVAIDFDRRRILFDMPEGADVSDRSLFYGSDNIQRY